jgi:hypothetical protein
LKYCGWSGWTPHRVDWTRTVKCRECARVTGRLGADASRQETSPGQLPSAGAIGCGRRQPLLGQRMLDPGSFPCSRRPAAKRSPTIHGPAKSPTVAGICATGLGVLVAKRSAKLLSKCPSLSKAWGLARLLYKLFRQQFQWPSLVPKPESRHPFRLVPVPMACSKPPFLAPSYDTGIREISALWRAADVFELVHRISQWVSRITLDLKNADGVVHNIAIRIKLDVALRRIQVRCLDRIPHCMPV